MIDTNMFVPRTQQDRYSQAILEQLIALNSNIEKLLPKETIQSDLPGEVKVIEKRKAPNRKKKEV